MSQEQRRRAVDVDDVCQSVTLAMVIVSRSAVSRRPGRRSSN